MAVHTAPKTRSTRRTLVSLLAIPLLSLAGLWGFTASITLGNVLTNQQINNGIAKDAPPATAALESLGTERALTVVWLSSGRHSSQSRTQLLAARHATDNALAALRVATEPIRGQLNANATSRVDTFQADYTKVPTIRKAVDEGTDSVVTAYTAYADIITTEFAAITGSVVPNDATFSLMTQTTLAYDRAEDFTGGAVALLAGALAAGSHMTQAERTLFGQVVAQQNLEISNAFATAATPELTAELQQAFDSPAYRRLLATENQVLSSPVGQRVPVSPAGYQATAQVLKASVPVQLRLAGILGAQAAQLKDSLLTELYLAGGLGLVAVLASVFVAVWFGRRLRLELANLYDSARRMADERLPRLVDRLRRGEDVDAETESPPLRTGRITEIANVAQAFTAVQRTAVEAAVGQAALRKGVNRVVVSLSLRNQSLLHRQLGMLDNMERATSDPVALADLFRLDHLTTRMRRHAEGLLILAGSTPGRGWHDPVPVADVLNAAVAEVEDYVRVDVVTDSPDAVAGTAVNDVIHLLAELVENATQFSPPNTRVEVRGDSVGHGFAIEVEDRGLGMPADEIAALNARLANPPEFDLANSDQLGLFVAARLAQRHSIKLSLRQSPFGGTTAIVLLSPSVIGFGNDAGWSSGTADADQAPGAPTGGAAHDSHPTRTGNSASAFGLTGRHHRSGSPQDPKGAPRPRFVRDPGFGPQRAMSGSSLARPALPAPGPAAPRPAPQNSPVPLRGRDEPQDAPTEVSAPNAWFSPDRTAGDMALDGIDFDATAADGTAFRRAEPDAAADGTRPGLPRRARGTNLAPQLRRKLSPTAVSDGQASEESAWPGSLAAAEPPARSPEETGSILSALQGGWERARIEDPDYFEGEDQR